MPYQRLQELPGSVRDHLPKHAQEIYRAAYNSAWDEYDHDEERAPGGVGGGEAQVRKNDETGDWVKKSEG